MTDDSTKEYLKDPSFKKVLTKNANPSLSGFYDTDKGELYWFSSRSPKGENWSSRADEVCDEHPNWWLSIQFDHESAAKSMKQEVEILKMAVGGRNTMMAIKDQQINMLTGYVTEAAKTLNTIYAHFYARENNEEAMTQALALIEQTLIKIKH